MFSWIKSFILILPAVCLVGCDLGSEVMGNGYAESYIAASLKENQGLKAFYDKEPAKKNELLEAVRKGYEAGNKEGAANAFLTVFWAHQQTYLSRKIPFTTSAKIMRYASSVADWMNMLESDYGMSCYDVGVVGTDINRLLLVQDKKTTLTMLSASDDILAGADHDYDRSVTDKQIERWFIEAVNAVSLEVAPKYFNPKFLWSPLSAKSPDEKLSACKTISAFLEYSAKQPQRGPILLRKYFSGE